MSKKLENLLVALSVIVAGPFAIQLGVYMGLFFFVLVLQASALAEGNALLSAELVGECFRKITFISFS